MQSAIVQIIDDFLLTKKNAGSEKILKDAINGIDASIKKSSETKETKEQVANIVKAKKSNELNLLDDKNIKFDLLCELKYEAFNVLDLKAGIRNKMDLLNEKYSPINWIDHVAGSAGEVSLNKTHIAKLTHSIAKGSNVNAIRYKSEITKPLLSTESAGNKLPIDFSYSDAKYSPVAKFLQLECEGEILGRIVCDDPFVLRSFANHDDQVFQWQKQFQCAFEESEKSSHELLKQVYFPVLTEYHLLTPLVSSSLAQFIYDRVWQTRQEDIPVRDARHKGLYCEKVDVLFHKTAILKATQTNHQNVSNLNGKRSGQLILFPCRPPQWKTQIKPPVERKTIFNRELSRTAKESIEQLQKLLLAIKLNDLSINLARKKLIASLVTEVADLVFDYVAQVQGLKHLAGWSQESKLVTHQQYWLDPFRQDEVFQTARTDLDWQADIGMDFARWINLQLKHPQLTLGVAHEKHWQKLFKQLLREYNALTDVTLAEHHLMEEQA